MAQSRTRKATTRTRIVFKVRHRLHAGRYTLKLVTVDRAGHRSVHSQTIHIG